MGRALFIARHGHPGPGLFSLLIPTLPFDYTHEPTTQWSAGAKNRRKPILQYRDFLLFFIAKFQTLAERGRTLLNDPRTGSQASRKERGRI